MAGEAGFVQALRADPTNDTTRLVFMDWLQEQDDPVLAGRGELMRLQDELARWVPDLARRSALQQRCQELRQRHEARWLGPLAGYVLEHRLEQGLFHITLTVEQFLNPAFAAQAEALFRQAWVGEVRLLAHAQGTGLSAPENLHLAAALVRAEHLRHVTSLDLRGQEVNDRLIEELAQAPAVAGLTALSLVNNDLTDRGAALLADSPHLGRLAVLDLRNNQISARGVRRLRRSKRLPALTRLEVQGHRLEQERFPHVRNSVGMVFVRIPLGTFLMGSPDSEEARTLEEEGSYSDEGPQHEVTLTRPFALGIAPVTQQQYQLVMGDNPAQFTVAGRGGPWHPVERVSFDMALEFCQQLSRLPAEREAGRSYRLPTEAEWEYACRAGETTPFAFGTVACWRHANFDSSSPYGKVPRSPYLQRTTAVGCYPPNGFGLFDMHGNVEEWCSDYYEQNYYRHSLPVDPQGPSSGEPRTARGGSWLSTGRKCRSASRGHWYSTTFHCNHIGFRVVLVEKERG